MADLLPEPPDMQGVKNALAAEFAEQFGWEAVTKSNLGHTPQRAA
jgi:hypothetical protein